MNNEEATLALTRLAKRYPRLRTECSTNVWGVEFWLPMPVEDSPGPVLEALLGLGYEVCLNTSPRGIRLGLRAVSARAELCEVYTTSSEGVEIALITALKWASEETHDQA